MIVYPALLFSRIALFPHCSFPDLKFPCILNGNCTTRYLSAFLHSPLTHICPWSLKRAHLPFCSLPRFRQRLERNRKPSGENPRPPSL
ncbi:TPA: hypothetical protein GE504_25900 [Escherichia coli]|nr:hypothetical protein [Escherichia coli]